MASARRLVIFLVLSIALVFSAVAFATTVREPTQLNARFTNTGTIKFFGTLRSDFARCKAARAVTVREGSRVIGTDLSDARGAWELPEFADPAGTVAHAITVRAQRREIHTPRRTVICRAVATHFEATY